MRVLRFMLLKKRVAAMLTIVTLLPAMLIAQAGGNKDVTGKVTDNSGNALSGVTVSVKSTKIATVTNAEGIYTIKAREEDVLVFSSASFTPKEVTVTAASVFNITMEAAVTTLGDVVVVGYGKSSKRTLVSSITSVKPEELNRGSISDVGQLLQGKVAGLNITSSGDPNRPAAVILRGATTLNSSQGIFYVIDGVPGADIATVAPDDIASIDILKDAAATAIYGNRASNGVIIITTKRAKKGQPVLSYNGYVSFESVSSQLKVMDATQLRAFVTKNGLAFTPADDQGLTPIGKKLLNAAAQLHTTTIFHMAVVVNMVVTLQVLTISTKRVLFKAPH